MLRRVLASVAALISFGVTVAVIESISHSMHPMPEGLDPKNQEALAAWIETLPTSAFALVLTAWTLGAGVGAAVGARIASSPVPAYVVLVAGVLSVVSNNLMIPGPPWMWSGVVTVTLAALTGARTAPTR